MWADIVAFVVLYWIWPVIFIAALIIGNYASDDKPGTSLFATGVLLLLLYFTGHLPIEKITLGEFFEYAAAYVFCGVLWSVLKWRSLVAKKLRDFKEKKFNFIKSEVEKHVKGLEEERQKQKQRQAMLPRGKEGELAVVVSDPENDARATGPVGLSREQFDSYSRDQVISHQIPKDMVDNFKYYLYHNDYIKRQSDDVIPNPGKMKSRIMSWMIWWPASILWDILSDWLLRFWEHIVDALKEFFARMAKRMYGKAAAEFQNEK